MLSFWNWTVGNPLLSQNLTQPYRPLLFVLCYLIKCSCEYISSTTAYHSVGSVHRTEIINLEGFCSASCHCLTACLRQGDCLPLDRIMWCKSISFSSLWATHSHTCHSCHYLTRMGLWLAGVSSHSVPCPCPFLPNQIQQVTMDQSPGLQFPLNYSKSHLGIAGVVVCLK